MEAAFGRLQEQWGDALGLRTPLYSGFHSSENTGVYPETHKLY